MIEQIKKILSGVNHPAEDKDIVSLGLVEDVKVENGRIKVKLVFPAPDPLSSTIKKDIETALNGVFPDMKVTILELVRERKTKRTVNDLGPENLTKVKHIIAIASGKGGVGKSTVSVNLACALARAGYKVGLTDADVYGPSVPKMTGTEGMMPSVEEGVVGDENDGLDMIVPIEKYGVKWMSIGYFAAPEQALIWRGAMACNALRQMIFQIKWDELDFLLIDLPPGTGDILISLVHDTPLDAAIIVSTPQAVALADVEKGVNMFRNKDVNTRILGLVENMAWFTPAELPNNKYYIFGKDGGQAMADKYNMPLLAQVPIVMSIRESGDNGTPEQLDVWDELAARVARDI